VVLSRAEIRDKVFAVASHVLTSIAIKTHRQHEEELRYRRLALKRPRGVLKVKKKAPTLSLEETPSGISWIADRLNYSKKSRYMRAVHAGIVGVPLGGKQGFSVLV
jgi:hypothetical protein